MKKLVCILLTLFMLMSAVSVLAFEQVTENGSPKYTSSANYTNSGDINDTNTEYEFKSPSGYYYTVIPVDTVTVDGEKQYLFISNNYYGKFPDGTVALTASATKEEREKFIFDPEITTSYAYWLNNGFFDGSKKAAAVNSNGGAALDSEIASYIRTHDWYVNGYNGKDADNTYIDKKYNFDYTVNCKVAVLSIDDIVKYAKYMKKTLKSAGAENAVSTDTYACILRTFGALDGAGASSMIKRQNPASGNAANSSSSLCGIRPIFYVSEDYFKNVKLDLTTAGSEVKKIISALNPSIYDDELLSLKEIYTLTEDGSKALSTEEWTNGSKVTVEGGCIKVPKSTYIGRLLEMNGGTLNVETDVVSTVANGLYIGFCEGTDSPKYKYPLVLGSSIVSYITAPPSSSSKMYPRLEDSVNKNLYYNLFASGISVTGTFRVKLNVNLDDGYCYAVVSGKGSDGNEYVKYSTAIKLDNYINKDKTFSKVAFWNSTSSAETVLDNIKITYDKNGSMIDSVNVTDKKSIEINVKDCVDLTNVTKDSVLVENNTVTSITKENGKIVATLKNNLEDGERTVIINDMKRNDVGSANYTIIGNSKVFTVETPTETVIGAPVISGSLTSGSTVTAMSAVTKGTSSDAKPVQFVIAAYNGDRLIGAKIVSVADVNTATKLKAEITLSENASEVRAFIWDADNYPIRSAVSKNQ